MLANWLRLSKYGGGGLHVAAPTDCALGPPRVNRARNGLASFLQRCGLQCYASPSLSTLRKLGRGSKKGIKDTSCSLDTTIVSVLELIICRMR